MLKWHKFYDNNHFFSVIIYLCSSKHIVSASMTDLIHFVCELYKRSLNFVYILFVCAKASMCNVCFLGLTVYYLEQNKRVPKIAR